MADFEPIPEEILRQSSVSRSVPREEGSTDRKSKSSDRHGGHKEKKPRSSKTKKRESSPAAQHGGGHRSGSNSSKSSDKYSKGEPLISLSSILDVDMAPETTEINNKGLWMIS